MRVHFTAIGERFAVVRSISESMNLNAVHRLSLLQTAVVRCKDRKTDGIAEGREQVLKKHSGYIPFVSGVVVSQYEG